jgi:hypothetical protein
METVAQETTAAAAVAGIASNIATVQTHVGAFDKIAAGLAELEKQHPKDVLIAEISTTAGMKSAIAARAAWRTPRLAVEKARKDAKAPVLALGKAIDSFAGELTAKLLAGEEHYDAQIKAEEQRKEAEKQAKAAAEAARVKAHQDRIANDIEAIVVASLRCTAEQIAQHIADIEALAIGDDFEEYRGKAEEAKADTLKQLRDMHAAAVEREAEAARLAAERAELAKLRAEQKKRDEEAAAARAEEERKAREQREAEEIAAALKRDKERAEHEAKLRAEREAHEAEMRRQREALAEQERQAAAARAEADRIAREAREAEERKAAAELAEAQRVAREAAAARQREEEARAAADKRLRDAAPRLLKALRALVTSMADSDEEGLIEHAPEMVEARAAIAEAEGAAKAVPA